MFKKNVNTPSPDGWILLQTIGIAATTLVLAPIVSGCRLLPPLPSVDLKEPGWSVKQGQGVWRFDKNKPEIAGEILLATKGDSQTYVQFTKGPFPMMTGQITPRGWQIQRGDTNKRYSAPGKPPSRIVLLQLPALLAGAPPPAGWIWQHHENNWRIENKKTGEFLEGFLE